MNHHRIRTNQHLIIFGQSAASKQSVIANRTNQQTSLHSQCTRHSHRFHPESVLGPRPKARLSTVDGPKGQSASRCRYRGHCILYLPPFGAVMDIDIDWQRHSHCVSLSRRSLPNPSRDPLGATVRAMPHSEWRRWRQSQRLDQIPNASAAAGVDSLILYNIRILTKRASPPRSESKCKNSKKTKIFFKDSQTGTPTMFPFLTPSHFTFGTEIGQNATNDHGNRAEAGRCAL